MLITLHHSSRVNHPLSLKLLLGNDDSPQSLQRGVSKGTVWAVTSDGWLTQEEEETVTNHLAGKTGSLSHFFYSHHSDVTTHSFPIATLLLSISNGFQTYSAILFDVLYARLWRLWLLGFVYFFAFRPTTLHMFINNVPILEKKIKKINSLFSRD